MAEEKIPEKHLPSDPAQFPIVWTYELLKYLRSKRLYAAIALVVAVLALIYLLPPALGHPYKGTDTNAYVSVTPLPQPIVFQGKDVYAFGLVNRSNLDPATLVLYRDGIPFPSDNGANWVFAPSLSLNGVSIPANAILFTSSVTGYTFTATYDWSVSTENFASRFAGFVNFLVIICATFFGADSIVSEYQNRTGYLIFPNPVKRSTLFFGKYAASITAGFMVILLFYAVVAALSYVTLSGLDKGFGLSLALAVEYLLAAIAVAYVISSVLRGSTGALVLTFFLFLLIFPIIDGVGTFTNTKMSWSLTFSAGALMDVLQHPYPVDTSQSVPGLGTVGVFYPSPETAAIVMAVWAIVAIALSLVMFRRKELLG